MLNQDFREFIQSLNDNEVRYLIVGGCASAVSVKVCVRQHGSYCRLNKITKYETRMDRMKRM